MAVPQLLTLGTLAPTVTFLTRLGVASRTLTIGIFLETHCQALIPFQPGEDLVRYLE